MRALTAKVSKTLQKSLDAVLAVLRTVSHLGREIPYALSLALSRGKAGGADMALTHILGNPFWRDLDQFAAQCDLMLKVRASDWDQQLCWALSALLFA